MGHLLRFCIQFFFSDMCDHANTCMCMYKRAYFVGLNFADPPGSMTTASINTFENFPLCSNTYVHGRASYISRGEGRVGGGGGPPPPPPPPPEINPGLAHL